MLRWGQKIIIGATFGTLVQTHLPPQGTEKEEESALLRLILKRVMARTSEHGNKSIVDTRALAVDLKEIGSEPSSFCHSQLFDLSVCNLTYLYYMSAFSLKGWEGEQKSSHSRYLSSGWWSNTVATRALQGDVYQGLEWSSPIFI